MQFEVTVQNTLHYYNTIVVDAATKDEALVKAKEFAERETSARQQPWHEKLLENLGDECLYGGLYDYEITDEGEHLADAGVLVI
jgi:hypothetical protein